MSARFAFNLGALLILAGLAVLLSLDGKTLPWLAVLGVLGLALVFVGIGLLEYAEDTAALEARQ
ncbi:hypothetical protein DKM44_02165 [Deinococcus irradiatisoli]|uniref:Uncharacterized protein n=1 Tax=Deinococcus irradiatisoli TaxID=2202254 RepID=A0A2Z3JLP5_9DEIO|nr:hypothetical protein [Deinococcus irradiatisoli]AWN22184.1 hypothetical protein DKM44_02165 [Deinococcus irradiatisoli]